MSTRNEHRLLGLFIGAVDYLSYKNAVNEPPTLAGIVGSALTGGVVALLPDEIEPPIGPIHRGFFHSNSALALATILAKVISENPGLILMQKHAYLTCLAAYGGHLLQDSTTLAGLLSI